MGSFISVFKQNSEILQFIFKFHCFVVTCNKWRWLYYYLRVGNDGNKIIKDYNEIMKIKGEKKVFILNLNIDKVNDRIFKNLSRTFSQIFSAYSGPLNVIPSRKTTKL